MDIYAVIREFYDFTETNPLTSSQIALWYALLHINNKARWEKWFTVSSQALAIKAGLTRQALIRARNTLKQYGLIDFKPNGNQATAYSLVRFVTATGHEPDTNRTENDTATGHEPDTNRTQTDTINNTNTKTKTKTKSVNNARARFEPPSVDEVAAYCRERGNQVDPGRFVDYYASKGWVVGKSPMKDWKAAVRTWEKNDKVQDVKDDSLLPWLN
jgi:hypothetical protein